MSVSASVVGPSRHAWNALTPWLQALHCAWRRPDDDIVTAAAAAAVHVNHCHYCSARCSVLGRRSNWITRRQDDDDVGHVWHATLAPRHAPSLRSITVKLIAVRCCALHVCKIYARNCDSRRLTGSGTEPPPRRNTLGLKCFTDKAELNSL